ncbi:MAG TPA: SLC13 family permease [bacterium]|jgi:di/tricarboxylate transporter|nr:SLC13 family permease [bacterium]
MTSQAGVIDPLEALMRRVPFTRGLDRVDLARLIGALEEISLPAGALIFAEGAPADGLYLLESGRVLISVETAGGEQPIADLRGPANFGELGLLLARRTGAARALSDVRLWRLPRHRFEQLARERPTIGLALATGLASRLEVRSREAVGAPLVEDRPAATLEAHHIRHSRRWNVVGAALAVGVPLALWFRPPPEGLTPPGWHVSLIVMGAALGWLFEPVPDFVVALLMAAAWGIGGLASLDLVFAGFTSSSWVVALGALALAAAMARSGLLFRIALYLLKTFPATHAGQVLALLAGGILVTPLVPLATARVSAVAPLARELAQAMGYRMRSRASAALSFAGLIGYGSFSSIFLTGLAMNFFVLELLPPADQARFSWLPWMGAAAVAGVVLLVGMAAVLLWAFRAEVQPMTAPEVLRRQERVLGGVARAEWVTIGAVAVLLGGLLIQPILRIETAWLAIGAVAVAMAGGALDREGFRRSIDWGFLVLFGVLLGTGGVLHSVGVDGWVAERLIPLSRAVGSAGGVVIILSLFVIAARLVLPRQPATLLLSLALVPVAPRIGLQPWVAGFVVLLMANTWLHPSQYDWYRLTKEATGDEMFTDRHGIILGIAATAVTLAAVTASILYWRLTGLLTP